jgi:hypothetical protein
MLLLKHLQGQKRRRRRKGGIGFRNEAGNNKIKGGDKNDEAGVKEDEEDEKEKVECEEDDDDREGGCADQQEWTTRFGYDVLLLRHLDSVLDARDEAAVTAWLASGLAFHVIR